jgi:hypothetical protein
MGTNIHNYDRGAILFDVPGAGKSTTVYLAALQARSSYVRIRLDRGVLETAGTMMRKLVDEISEPITTVQLLERLKPACYGALARTFEQCAEMLMSKKEC